MRRLVWIFFLVFALPAVAEERIALVIGNSAYGNVTPLDNSARDAELMAATLESVGFKVTRLIDSSQLDMKRGIAAFGRMLRQAGPEATGLFYYAGHGVQSFGTNYLLPVDVMLQDAADLDLVAIEAQSVLRQMFSARNRTNIVVLDACRNNPFENIPEFTEAGLAEMKAPTGTFLAYATEPGGVALDGIDGNSPFTKALARRIVEPGQEIEQVFKNVRVEVLEVSGGRQTPWDTSSLTVSFNFVAGEKLSGEELAEREYWNTVQETRDTVQLMLFLRAYPKSRYATEARALLNALMQEELDGTAQGAEAAQAGGGQSDTGATGAAGPSDAEQAAFAQAQEMSTIEGYRAFLEAFPNGTFTEFVQGEIAALSKKAGLDPDAGGDAPEPVVVAEPAKPEGDLVLPDVVTFDAPLAGTGTVLDGKLLADVVKSSPMFPPIEGLPEELWKSQTCSNCHQWERDNLCAQAQTYLKASAQRSLTKEHPFGGALKRKLKNWAANDCR